MDSRVSSILFQRPWMEAQERTRIHLGRSETVEPADEEQTRTLSLARDTQDAV